MSKIEELPKVLLRVTSRKKAERFVKKGIIEFGSPKQWIEYCKKNGNNEIGDEQEGLFLRRSILQPQPIISDPDIIKETKEGYVNCWSRNVLKTPTLCFYGIGINNIVNFNVRTLYHTQNIGFVDTSYFKSFLNNAPFNKEEHSRVNKKNQKVVIIIYEPVRLVQLIKEKAKCRVSYSNVEYVDKKKNFCSNCPHPFELFYKGNEYKPQSEFRLILDNPTIKRICLGDISAFCRIEEMYFERMDFAFQDDNKFLYSLPEPIKENYYEKGFEEMCTFFLTMVDLEYPYQRKRIEDYYYLINYAKPYFKKYGIEPYVSINEKTNSFNIKYTFENDSWKNEFYKIYNDLHRYNDKHFHEIAIVKDYF